MKQIKISIEIESQTNYGKHNIEIFDILFPDISRTFENEYFIENTKQALKVLKGNFSMITISVLSGGYPYTPIVAYRTINDSGAIKTSYTKGRDSFNHWNDSNKQTIFQNIKDAVIEGNSQFIEGLKSI